MRYIDLSHEFVDNMPVFPGDPPTTLKQIASVAKEGYTDHQLTTVMHVGTHMDAPLHMIEGGKYMSEIPIDHFAGPGVLIDARGQKTVDADLLRELKIPSGGIALVLTGMDKKYKTPGYETGYPSWTEAFARALVSSGIKVVGMDMMNPDTDESYPIHKILLSKEVLIIENLTNLETLVGVQSFDVYAFPVKLRAEAAPVRVVARVK